MKKKQEPVDQHYVPEVYLKGFANLQKKFFQLRKKYGKIRESSIGQVCYQQHYFTIQREETKQLHRITDPFHIERNTFKKQENNYERLLRKFTFPRLHNLRLSRAEVKEFLGILISIKRRNPTVRKHVMEHYRQYFNSEELWKDVAPVMDLARSIDPIDPEEYLRGYIETINRDDSKLSDFYLRRFLETEQKVISNVIETLMQYKVCILHAPVDHSYATSDNPSFTIAGNNILLNYGGFGGDFAFMCPLTSSCCLVIDSDEADNRYDIDKQIYVRQVAADAVMLTNQYTTEIAMERVFAYSRKTLEYLLSE